MEAKIGMIAKSNAGHDSGKFHVITALDGDFAYICDGKERKLSFPKKKRLKHLKFTNTVIETGSLTDKRLRTILREYTEGLFPET